jgi:hypothetical protein
MDAATGDSPFASKIEKAAMRGEFNRSQNRNSIMSTSKREKSQHFIPFRFVFEHDLAEETNGRHAVIEKFVVKLSQ